MPVSLVISAIVGRKGYWILNLLIIETLA